MTFLLVLGAASLSASVLLLLPWLRTAGAGVGRRPWRTGVLLAVAVPAAAVALYAASGRPAQWLGAQAAHEAELDDRARIQASIAQLADRLRANPDDGAGWLLLARSYQETGQPEDALSAYARAVERLPDDADLIVEYANALGRRQGRLLAGQPAALLRRALAIDPDNLNALALAGAAALQAGQADEARHHWQRLRGLTPADSPDRARVEALLAQAQGVDQGAAVPAGAGDAGPTAAGASIRGVVRLSPALAGRVAAGDTLFIFARSPGGEPLPIAALRKPAAGWPVAFVLDDRASMMPGRVLSGFESVELVARVSHTGSPQASAGDLEGGVGPIAVGSDGIELLLDRIVPEP